MIVTAIPAAESSAIVKSARLVKTRGCNRGEFRQDRPPFRTLQTVLIYPFNLPQKATYQYSAAYYLPDRGISHLHPSCSESFRLGALLQARTIMHSLQSVQQLSNSLSLGHEDGLHLFVVVQRTSQQRERNCFHYPIHRRGVRTNLHSPPDEHV